MAGKPVIDRASTTDRAFLAMDGGRTPEHFGVILLFDEADGFVLGNARRLLADRVGAVPRLRQRLVTTPFGCGGPIWVDDAGFDVQRRIRVVSCAQPGDERALLDTAYSLVATPLPSSGPRWSAAFVTGLADGQVALVIAVHHVLVDGVGGLELLTALVDPGRTALSPRPRPTTWRLALDAWSSRIRAVGRIGTAVRLLRASTAAAGGLRSPRAEACSLLRRIGGSRRPAVVRIPVAVLRAAAHQYGATTNDAILVAVAAALNRVLASSGESLKTVVIGVPVSGHTAGEPARGNLVSPLVVPVPAVGDLAQRLRCTAEVVRSHKAAAQGPPPIALLGWLFRPLAAFGAFRWYMNHQRRLHTLVSHVRGPRELISFGGSPIRSAIPIGVGGDGNMTVYFEVFTYAGTVTITAMADPERFPDPGLIACALGDELDLISARAGRG
ncbi:wax ester/triacylglycerol synthase domain-containing protein [Lentzea kentuckyensis]|uniref:wax ester/triacylglycerol synthase domain-containing protein n=1 Tax=Lentzea kentuckyensis TaxID=360086 RepID=UPI001302A3AE|nr:wax ester/triacylglycerol synthase domain-containing protein [Lentzea kentuckyensis]